jgi:hypothetical protein
LGLPRGLDFFRGIFCLTSHRSLYDLGVSPSSRGATSLWKPATRNPSPVRGDIFWKASLCGQRNSDLRLRLSQTPHNYFAMSELG